MNRRYFIKNFLLTGTSIFLSQIFNNSITQAAVRYCNPNAPMRRRDVTGRHNLELKLKRQQMVKKRIIDVPAPAIKETHLKFMQPLEKRKETDMVVIHHIGNTNRDVSAAEVHQWHLANGWAGIGYHYIIRKNGTIERGRPLEMVGAHCYGYNRKSIGINIVGDFEVAVPTKAQMESAKQLTAYLCEVYNINDKEKIIFGHRDLNDTLCPGKNLYVQLNDFRSDVFKRIDK